MAAKHVLVLLLLMMMKNYERVYGGGGREMRTEGDCWGSLMELKSCTSEIMEYLVNGRADIGPRCCAAVTVITHDCWPPVLSSLGFTQHQAFILRGYCDAVPALAPSL